MATATSGLSNKPGDAFFQKLLATSRFAAIGVGASVVSTIAPASAWAAKVDFTPTISISETYTDNVELSPPGLEQYDWVTDVTPGFRFSGTGARARINLDYTPSLLTFARRNETDLRHRLSNAGEMELAEGHLFLNESSSISQRYGSARGRISISDQNISGDRRQVYSFKVGPTLRNRFGSIASASLGYSFSGVYSDKPADPTASIFSDTNTHSVNLAINSGEDFQRFKWGLSGNWRKEIRQGGGRDITDKSASANARYSLTRTVAVIGSVGYQDYEFLASTGRNSFNWDVGVRLTPSRRLTLSVTYGDETNHRRWTFNGSYQPTPYTSVSASYNETFQTQQSVILGQLPTLNNTPSFGGGLGSSFNLLGPAETPGNTFTDRVFLQKRFSFSASHSKGRTSFSFSAYQEKRTAGGTLLDKVLSANGSIKRTFTPLVTGSLYGSFIRSDYPGGQQDDIYLGSATLNRRLAGPVSAYLTYSYTRRDSNNALSQLEENAVTLGVSASF